MGVEYRMCTYLLLAVGGWTAGCAGPAHESRTGPAEVRQSIAVSDSQPRLLLVGPARLLHVQIESDRRKSTVSVFRAPRKLGTSADCEVKAEGGRGALSGRGASVDISKDEVVCAKVEANVGKGKVSKVDRRARLSFHALATPEVKSKEAKEAAPAPLHEASLLH